MKKNIVFGFLGTILDLRGKGEKRWLQWRPTIDICAHKELPIARFELLYNKESFSYTRQLVSDIKKYPPTLRLT